MHPAVCGHLAVVLAELCAAQRERVIGMFVELVRDLEPTEAAMRALAGVAEADRLRAALSHPDAAVRRQARARQVSRGTVL